jgi:hypothetical protein
MGDMILRIKNVVVTCHHVIDLRQNDLAHLRTPRGQGRGPFYTKSACRVPINHRLQHHRLISCNAIRATGFNTFAS